MLLTARRICKRFGPNAVLRNAAFSVREGEVLGLIGPNGSGKTTLFVTIHQLADAGRICDRLVLLSRGEVVGEGTLQDLRRQAGIIDGGLEEIFLALT